MAIVKMKRLRLIAMREEQEELLKALQHLGCVEISQPEAEENAPEWAGLSRPDSAALNEARNDGATLAAALAALEEYSTEKKSMFAARPSMGMRDFFDDNAYAAALELADFVVAKRRSVDTLRAQHSKLASRRAALIPWMPLDVPLNNTIRSKTRKPRPLLESPIWIPVLQECEAAKSEPVIFFR